MSKKLWPLVAGLLILTMLLGACKSSTPTPSPTPTAAPTQESEAQPTPAPAGGGEIALPSAPLDLQPPDEAGTCEPSPLPVLPVRPVDETDWVRGPDDAAITLLEYSDFQCPGCSGIEPVLEVFLTDHPDIRLVYRHFPLSFHDKSMLTALAAEAAGAQGKFWEMHDLLFERAAEWKQLSQDEARAKMSDYARELGLDMAQFEKDMDEETYKDKVERDLQEAQSVGLPGTPSFLFNGILFPTQELGLSYQGLESFLDILDLGERMYDEPPAMTVDESKEYEVVLHTSKGDMTLKLYPQAAPTNVNNFLFLAHEGWYDNTQIFFVRDNFVALMGDPTNSGIGYPGYYCTGETQNGFDGAGLVGILPNGQFFITLGDEAQQLSGNFALIGQVTKGADVLASLTRRTPGDPTAPPADMLESVEIVNGD